MNHLNIAREAEEYYRRAKRRFERSKWAYANFTEIRLTLGWGTCVFSMMKCVHWEAHKMEVAG